MTLDFCPTCGQPMAAQDQTHYRCQAGHDYFNNPRAAAAIILVNDAGELLFARRGREPQKDKYDFPGGFVDFGENAPEAAIRELHEELGIVPNDLELIGTVSNSYLTLTSTMDCVYLCRSWQGELHPADDVASVAWHPLDFLRSEHFAWPTYHALHNTLAEHLQADPIAVNA